MVGNILMGHRQINVCGFVRSRGQVEQKPRHPALRALINPQRVSLNASELGCGRLQEEICNLVVARSRRKQDIPLEKQDQGISCCLDRQRMG